MQLDLLYWVASITKLATAVAVVQLIERGVLSLDDDVREKLPELEDIQIIHNMKYGTSQFHDRQVMMVLTFIWL